MNFEWNVVHVWHVKLAKPLKIPNDTLSIMQRLNNTYSCK